MRRHLKRDEPRRVLAESGVFSGYILPNGNKLSGKCTVVVFPSGYANDYSARPAILGTSVPWQCPFRTFDAVKKWVESQFTTKVEDWRVYENAHSGKA